MPRPEGDGTERPWGAGWLWLTYSETTEDRGLEVEATGAAALDPGFSSTATAGHTGFLRIEAKIARSTRQLFLLRRLGKGPSRRRPPGDRREPTISEGKGRDAGEIGKEKSTSHEL